MPPTMAHTWNSHWHRAAQRGTYPFDGAPYEDAKRVMEKVTPLFDAGDREAYTTEFIAAAAPHEARARELEAKGDTAGARMEYVAAYGLYRMARFPCLNTPGKKAAYKKSQDCALKARSFDPVPVQRVEMPFKGRAGEGDKVVGYLRLPPNVKRPPVQIIWGGIDSFKEEVLNRTDTFIARGVATITMDMPGTGDSPVLGSEDGERQWDAVFDWIAAQPNLDSSRVCAWGGSFGGYWATKVAHTHRERLAGIASQGGGAHIIFTADWIAKSQEGGIPWGQNETRGNSFGKPVFEQWRDYAPRLSLLTQGVLDRPCAPLLCVNGVKDPITPIADYHIVLEHGGPKEARFFPNGGHMGTPLDGSPDTATPMLVDWLCRKLLASC
jgi:pimeloyl-ACP methyl ester carboxylesterase